MSRACWRAPTAASCELLPHPNSWRPAAARRRLPDRALPTAWACPLAQRDGNVGGIAAARREACGSRPQAARVSATARCVAPPPRALRSPERPASPASPLAAPPPLSPCPRYVDEVNLLDDGLVDVVLDSGEGLQQKKAGERRGQELSARGCAVLQPLAA